MSAAEGPSSGAELCVGVGTRRGVPAAEVYGAVVAALRAADLSPRQVARLATVTSRATEPCIVAAARRLRVPLCSYAPGTLSAVEVPNPSPRTLRSTGTPSVAEASALLAAGKGGQLLLAKHTPAPEGRQGRPPPVTVAVARPARPARHSRLRPVGPERNCAGRAGAERIPSIQPWATNNLQQ
ncbi:cobalamin biosynthesis protein [Streptomyces sp. TR06-5]|uniref:cobalamin biosynthesis protein n=1 Tax=unclassified Streptomyces TaxID=2593676 RepID=UPI00399EF0FE